MSQGARLRIAGLALACAAFVPPGDFCLDRAAGAARRRVGARAVYDVGGVPTALAVLPGGVVVFDPPVAPPAAAVVRRLLAGDAAAALAAIGGDPSSAAFALGPEGPVLSVGAGRADEPEPRVFLHPETFVTLGARAGGLEVDLLGTASLAATRGLPVVIEVRAAGAAPWRAVLRSRGGPERAVPAAGGAD